jgi:hypothetical protein
MKIRKFNEGLGDNTDIDYIKWCFQDLIDSGARISDNGSFFDITISLPVSPILRMGGKFECISEANQLDKFLDDQQETAKFFSDIKVSFNKLRDEYPDYMVTSTIDDNSVSIYIRRPIKGFDKK